MIHPSQFPDRAADDLAVSLRSRSINHKFHYDTVKQANQWVRIHRAFSPAVTDPGCAGIYEAACHAAAGQIPPGRAEVVGLGCGSGWKDAVLLRALAGRGVRTVYWAVDSSAPMTLIARQNTTPEAKLLVCDLASPLGVPAELVIRGAASETRIVTFYGMLPNFEPDRILPVLASMLREEDILLFSANLAPGRDYLEGARSVLPLYDNAPTRAWLMIFLLDLGFEEGDGELRFSIRSDTANEGLLRIEAVFVLGRSREITVAGEVFRFERDESIRLFFSYRHTPERVRSAFVRYGMEIEGEWINATGEEGVFLARKRGAGLA